MATNDFSRKQLQILAFPNTTYDALLCDGAIRSGKTSVMSMAFIIWAMRDFNGQNFAICGKTVQTATKNIIAPLLAAAYFPRHGYAMRFNRAENRLTVTHRGRVNTFYVYGGKDESSYMLIQGITLAGVLLDEVALMTRSFVEQALARCSVEGSKFWFNCNPAGPKHWFYTEWVLKSAEKNAMHLHFQMQDNPSLSGKMLQRYESLYTGVFYDRYIRGLWVMAEGLIYPMFGAEKHVAEPPKDPPRRWMLSMDYGIQNPTAVLLWGEYGGVWYAVDEYYHSGRETNEQKTDEEYYDEICKLADRWKIPVDVRLIVDPSAASFIALVRKKSRFSVRKAKNEVIPGIQAVSSVLNDGKILFSPRCKRTIEEFGLYSWDEKSTEDKPIKENDHAMDCIRYFVYTNGLQKPQTVYNSVLGVY